MTKCYDLGVLFVHGIGDQPQGATLVEFGTPLVEWLLERAGAVGWNVHVLDASLTSDDDTPAHAKICIEAKSVSVVRRWLIAEAWWAQSFRVPRFADLARWGLAVVAWTFVSHFGARLHRALRERSSGLWGRFMWLSRVFSAFVALLGGMVLSILMLLVLTGLLVVGLIPSAKVRSAVVAIQLRMASSIGDSYVLIARPIESAAIYSRFLRNLTWLKDRCEQVAIVAHSQGAAVACHALSANSANVELLLTFGSGLRKLEEQRQLRDKPEFLSGAGLTLAGFVVAVFVAVTTPSILNLVHLGQASPANVPVLLTTGVIGLMLLLAGMLDFVDGPELERVRDLRRFFGQKKMNWKDVYASADPVPNGKLGDDDDNPPESIPVVNLKAMMRDHNSYWRNRDEFVTVVSDSLLQLDDAATPLRLPPQMIKSIKQRRHRRVTLLRVAWWTTLVSMTASLIQHWRDWITVTGWTAHRAAEWIANIGGWRIEPIPFPDAAVWRRSLGSATLILLFYLIARWLWFVWNKWEMGEPQRMRLHREGIWTSLFGIPFSHMFFPLWLVSVWFVVLVVWGPTFLTKYLEHLFPLFFMFYFIMIFYTSPQTSPPYKASGESEKPVRSQSYVVRVVLFLGARVIGPFIIILGCVSAFQDVRDWLTPWFPSWWSSLLAAGVAIALSFLVLVALLLWLDELRVRMAGQSQAQ